MTDIFNLENIPQFATMDELWELAIVLRAHSRALINLVPGAVETIAGELESVGAVEHAALFRQEFGATSSEQDEVGEQSGQG